MPQNPIKQARTALNLTQKELSALAQVSPVVITNVENGLYLEPPPSVCLALAQALEALREVAITDTIALPALATLPRADLALASLQVRPTSGPQIATTARKLKALYRTWVESQRQENKDAFQQSKSPRQCRTFTQWRKSVNDSQYGFCKTLVFDPRVLQYYESDGSRPETLFSALGDVLSKEEVTILRGLPHDG